MLAITIFSTVLETKALPFLVWLKRWSLFVIGYETLRKEEIAGYQFLAPLAEGQQAIVMALCLSCVHPFVRAGVRKLFLQKTSPQKLLTGFLPNFTRMFHR